MLTIVAMAGMLLAACGGGGEHHDDAAAKHAAMMKADSAAKAAVAAQEATARAAIGIFNGETSVDMETIMVADHVDHQQDPSITTTGIQGARDMLALVRTAYPDFKQEIEAMSTNGDRTYAHVHITGTNSGPWGAMPATGKAMDIMGVDIFRFQDGKIAEHWGYMEEMKMMVQLGLMPAPGAEAATK